MLQNRQGPWLPALGTRTTGPGNEKEAMARSDVDGKEAERKGERGQRSVPFLKAMAARWRGTERKKRKGGPMGASAWRREKEGALAWWWAAQGSRQWPSAIMCERRLPCEQWRVPGRRRHRAKGPGRDRQVRPR
jgi:hypothetical protein